MRGLLYLIRFQSKEKSIHYTESAELFGIRISTVAPLPGALRKLKLPPVISSMRERMA